MNIFNVHVSHFIDDFDILIFISHLNIYRSVYYCNAIILICNLFFSTALPPRCSTSLADIWENLHHPPAGIIDGLVLRYICIPEHVHVNISLD